MARLVVVTPNPAIDVTYQVERQEIGTTIRVDRVRRRAGGKGVNVARVLHDLGRTATAVLPLGGEAGRWLAADLLAQGVPVRAVPVTAETRTTVTVVDGVAHPTLFAEPGAPPTHAEWDAVLGATADECEPGGTLVVSGSLPAGTDPRRMADLVRAGRRRGSRTVVDTSGDALLTAAEAGADLVKPNRAEALAATCATDLAGAMADLHRRGAALVVVALGADGLVATAADGDRWTQSAVPGVTGNPTGAGDAATAGLVAALDAGAPLADALRQAALAGAAAVHRDTAGEVDPADLAELADRLPAGTAPLLSTADRQGSR